MPVPFAAKSSSTSIESASLLYSSSFSPSLISVEAYIEAYAGSYIGVYIKPEPEPSEVYIGSSIIKSKLKLVKLCVLGLNNL